LDPERYLVAADYDCHVPPEERHSAAAFLALRAHPEATAIMARNDFGAVQIHVRCQREGIRIPDDLSLVGFDDAFPIYNTLQENILTTVHLPLEQIGRQAAAMSIRQVEGVADPAEQIMLPSSLIIRGTTGQPRC
jgi:LacI family transcriptional regulator